MSQSARKLVLISTASPWGGKGAGDALDMALAAGAFELPVSILWQAEGVLQLVKAQDGAALEQKDVQAQLGALPLFGIEQLYVSQADLDNYALKLEQLLLPVQPLSSQQLQQLLQDSDEILVF